MTERQYVMLDAGVRHPVSSIQFYIFIFALFLIAATAPAQVMFTDVTEAAGLGGQGASMTTWGDYDNDGDVDVLLTPGKRLYRNEGDGTFLDVAQTAGITGIGNNAPIFLDFDNDGDLDLFMSGTNSTLGDLLYRNRGDGTFVDVSQTAGMESESRAVTYGFALDAISFDYDNNGLLDIFVTNFGTSPAFPNFVYRNEGNGRFEEVATQIGFDKLGFGGIALGDYDDDGDLDIFMAGTGSPIFGTGPDLDQGVDMLYRNEGDGAFIDVAEQAGVQGKSNHVSGFFWDYDNDGDLDLFIRTQHRIDADGFNILYRNNGDGTFTEVTQQAGIA